VTRVVVIGAGIVGSCVAAHAAVAGADVTLIDALARPTQATSRWSFAWLNSNQKEPEHYHRLNVAGMQEYERLSHWLGGPKWYHPDGNIEWTNSDHEQEFERRLVRLSEYGYPFTCLSQENVSNLAPALGRALQRSPP
jgi:glycine/D-amino acid oxidase-like deaminating enzyme